MTVIYLMRLKIAAGHTTTIYNFGLTLKTRQFQGRMSRFGIILIELFVPGFRFRTFLTSVRRSGLKQLDQFHLYST